MIPDKVCLSWLAIAGGHPLKNPLDSLWGTIVAGLVLTLILYFVVKTIQPVGV